MNVLWSALVDFSRRLPGVHRLLQPTMTCIRGTMRAGVMVTPPHRTRHVGMHAE